MAGPTPQSAVVFTNMDGTSGNLTGGGTLTEEVNTGQCYAVQIIINCTGNASATNDVRIEVYMKTGSAGTACNSPMFTTKLNVSGGASDGAQFTLDPGTWDIKAVNEDATYAATITGYKRLLT